jgi:hypothetical protein
VSEMLYGPGHFSFARSFRYVHAYAEVGSDGDDTAYLYDSPGDDLLLARDADPGAEDWAKLCDEADTLFAMWAHGFDTVYADSGTGDNDTADIGENLDFSLQLTGTWENQI